MNDIYKNFVNGKLLGYYNQYDLVKEVCSQRFSHLPVLSVGQASNLLGE